MVTVVLAAVFLGFWVGTSSAASTNLDLKRDRQHVNHYDIVSLCPTDGGKKEVQLRAGMAVLTLNESDPKTKERLKGGFNCHLELETSSDHGFHLFIEEMYLVEVDLQCSDFLQFGRDVLFLTNFKSDKYCGSREKLMKKETVVQESKPRVYTESQDREMDVWLSLKPNNKENGFKPRNLTLIATVYKKGCAADDPFFRACPKTQNCIRKEFFCDGLISCAWPASDSLTDESCDNISNDSYATNSGIFIAANIPVIIIVVIVLTAVFVVFTLACFRFAVYVKRSPEGDDDRCVTVPLGPNVRSTAPTNESDPAQSHYPEDATFVWPSMPPSYEEATKLTADHQQPVERLPSDPPPYTPSPPCLQTAI